MTLEGEPKPSMQDIVEAELEKDFLGNKERHPNENEDVLRENAMRWYLNNFPNKLPGGHSYFPFKGGVRITREESTQDLESAITTSGVDRQKLEEALKQKGNAIRDWDIQSMIELLLPIFVKLREMGYEYDSLT